MRTKILGIRMPSPGRHHKLVFLHVFVGSPNLRIRYFIHNVGVANDAVPDDLENLGPRVSAFARMSAA